MRDARSTDLITDGLLLGGIVLLCGGLLLAITMLLPVPARTALAGLVEGRSSPVSASR